MSSNATAAALADASISSFLYRNVGSPALQEHVPFFSEEAPEPAPAPVIPQGVPQHEVERFVTQARAEGAAEVRQQMQAGAEAHSAEQTARIEHALQSFQHAQKKYFHQAETEIVQLALAIAGRILHREAQVEPMLVAGLVRVAIEKLSSGSTVTVRVSPEQSEYWRAYRAATNHGFTVLVVEDAEMKATDCVLDTELGSADFSLEAQLKEVEQGFCDLLALRPQNT